MPSTISGSQIAAANLLIGGTYLSDTISTIESKVSNNYLQAQSYGDVSNNYLQAQSYGTGDVSNTYLQAQSYGNVSNNYLQAQSYGNVSNNYIQAQGYLSVENGVIKLPTATSNPSSPTSGDLYYNTTDNAVKHYDGTIWRGPASVIFEAARSAGHVSATNVILWDDVSINIGSHYDSSTGRFTAPTDGIYEFHWGGIKNNTSGVVRLNLRKNGTALKQNRLADGDVYNVTIWTMYLSLNASDYVDVEVTENSFYGTASIYNTFGGRLIG